MSDMQFFVDPGSTKTIYPWGENKPFVVVKQFLSAREEQDVRASGIPHMMAKASDAELSDEARKEREMKMGLDMGRMKLVRAAKYIVDWSITLKGKRVEPNEQSIGNMLPHVFDVLDKALDEHKAKMEAEKKAESGETTPTLVSA